MRAGLTWALVRCQTASGQFDSAKTIPPQHVWRRVPLAVALSRYYDQSRWPLPDSRRKQQRTVQSNASDGAQEDGTLRKSVTPKTSLRCMPIGTLSMLPTGPLHSSGYTES